MARIPVKKFLQRTLTVLLLAPVVLFIIYFDIQPYGTLPFLIFIISIAVMSLNEYFHMACNENDPFFLTGQFFAILLIFLAFMQEFRFFWISYLAIIISTIIIVTFLIELTIKKLLFSRNKLVITAKGVFYIGWCYSYFILIRNLPFPYGKNLIFYVLLTIWALDISAYIFGMLFGKHKLYPEISPKKSKEGAVAGFLAATLTSWVLLHHIYGTKHAIILGAIIGILGQCGDLYESLIKRTYNVKDSSNILPGHGGILDRADSFILLAPIVYYYLLIFPIQ